MVCKVFTYQQYNLSKVVYIADHMEWHPNMMHLVIIRQITLGTTGGTES